MTDSADMTEEENEWPLTQYEELEKRLEKMTARCLAAEELIAATEPQAGNSFDRWARALDKWEELKEEMEDE